MYGSGCKNCPAYQKCSAEYRSSRCTHNRATYGVESDPFTNGDRIRNMGDEALAEVLGKLVHCGGCPMRDNCKVDNLPCNNVLLEWLKQPAE